MANLVSFQSLTAAEYEALSGEYVENRIYFITDSRKLMLNGNEYGGGGDEMLDTPLTIKNIGSGDLTFELNIYNALQNGNPPTHVSAEIEYSLDEGETWHDYLWSDCNNINFKEGDKLIIPPSGTIQLRGDNDTLTYLDYGVIDDEYTMFLSGSDASAYGNLLSVLDKKMEKTVIPHAAFYEFFRGYAPNGTGLIEGTSTLKDVSGLRIPATTIEDFGLSYLLGPSVTNLPQLSADSVGYRGMRCYAWNNLLTKADLNLPATIVSGQAYSRIIYNNTNLSSVFLTMPSAYTIAGSDAFIQAFLGDSKLAQVSVNWDTWPTYNGAVATTNWLNGASSEASPANFGAFYCPSGLVIPSRDASGVPELWTICPRDTRPLIIETREDNATVRLDMLNYGSSVQYVPQLSGVTLEYSTDSGETWSDYHWSSSGYGGEVKLKHAGDTVMFRGDNARFGIVVYNGVTLSYEWGFNFKVDKQFNVRGNLMSLLNKNGMSPYSFMVPAGTFNYLFYNCSTLIDSSDLTLMTELRSIAPWAYHALFCGCSSMTATVPKINCGQLVDTRGFNNMFQNCTALTSIPYPNATTIGNSAYSSYVRGTGITSYEIPGDVPQIIGDNPWNGFFRQCSSLSSVTVHWTTWPTYNETVATSNWLNGVAAGGTFHCPASLTIPSRDTSGVPEGWTIETF